MYIFTPRVVTTMGVSILVLLLVGGAYYIVQQDSGSTETVASKCDASYKSFYNENIGISFCYPETWTVVGIMDKPENHIVGSVVLLSPDYESVEVPIGGTETGVGSLVNIVVYSIEQLGASYQSVNSILDGTAQTKGRYSGVEGTKIADKDGVTYIGEPSESYPYLANRFEYGGNVYMIYLDKDINGPSFNDNLDVYQKIVDTFELVSQ